MITIKSLASGSELYTKRIRSVELLGYGKVKFSRTDKGLIITLPQQDEFKSIAPVLKIK